MACGDARQRLDLKNGDVVDLGDVADGEVVVRAGDELVGAVVSRALKREADIATTTSLPSNTLSGVVLTATANGAFPSTMDGVSVVPLLQRILVKDEGTAAKNGIYELTVAGNVSTPWQLTRVGDADDDADWADGLVVFVKSGTANGKRMFRCTATGAISLGSTSLPFEVYPSSSGGGTGDLRADGTVPMAADFDLDGHKVVSVAVGSAADDAAVVGQVPARVVEVKTATWSIGTGDRGTLYRIDTTSGAVTATLPTAPAEGFIVHVEKSGGPAGSAATIAAGGSDVIKGPRGASGSTLAVLRDESFTLVYDATTAAWIVWAHVAVGDGAAGTPTLRSLGLSGVTACAGNDSRLSDARTPTAHATSHEPGGSDAMAVDAGASTGSLRTLGTGAAQACAGNDSRLSDSRAPSGSAGGALGGTYPNPTLASGYVAPQFLLKSSDQTAIGTSFADVSGLGFTLAAGKTYRFEFWLVMDSDATTTGIDVAVNGPSSPTFLYYSQVYWTSATAQAERGATAYDNNTASTGSNGTAAKVYRVFGIIKTGASGGTLIPRAKREAVGSGPACRAGSHGLLYLLD